MRGPLFAALGALLVGALGACRPPADPREAAAARADRATVVPGPGVTLARTCVVTGPELCFNAIDDNCNGLVDEGCGVRTGLVQILAAWDEPGVDVDLALELPSGANVDKGMRSRDGFSLDRDCPKDGCADQNEEGLFFQGGEPAAGEYVVTVKLAKPGDLTLDGVTVHVGGRLGTRSYAAEVRLTAGHPSAELRFRL